METTALLNPSVGICVSIQLSERRCLVFTMGLMTLDSIRNFKHQNPESIGESFHFNYFNEDQNMPAVTGMNRKTDTILQHLQGRSLNKWSRLIWQKWTKFKTAWKVQLRAVAVCWFISFLPCLEGEKSMFPKHCSIADAAEVPRQTRGKNVPLPCPTQASQIQDNVFCHCQDQTQTVHPPSQDLRSLGWGCALHLCSLFCGGSLCLLQKLLFYPGRMKGW